MMDMPTPYIAEYAAPIALTTLATLIKIPTDTAAKAYAELTCTEEDQLTIYEIITTIADHGKVSLLFKKNHVQGLGAQINHVHPLKFLSTIVTNPRLRACLDNIFDDYFKRNGFMDGLAPSLTREAEKGKLDQYVEEFANEVGVSSNEIRTYFQDRDWDSLVRHFMNN